MILLKRSDLMKINVTGGTLPQQEIDYYTEMALKKYPERNITAIDMDIDGDYVNCTYHFCDQPFERIRRITGYLVGTLDRFNNAKRAEEADRVKHGLTQQ
jgi:anaerobic ribonucleoside-triphosphate reductase